MKRIILSAAIMAIAGLAGCTGPRVVSKTDTEVVIAIPEDSDTFPTYYRSEAEKLARKESGGSPIQLKGITEAKVGEQTTRISRTNEQPNADGVVQTSADTTTKTDKLETRMTYVISRGGSQPTIINPRQPGGIQPAGGFGAGGNTLNPPPVPGLPVGNPSGKFGSGK